MGLGVFVYFMFVTCVVGGLWVCEFWYLVVLRFGLVAVTYWLWCCFGCWLLDGWVLFG